MKATEIKEITYAVVSIHEGQSYTEYFTFQQLFFYKNIENREVVFALNEEFEKIIKMNKGDQMPIRICRDVEEWGILERMK